MTPIRDFIKREKTLSRFVRPKLPQYSTCFDCRPFLLVPNNKFIEQNNQGKELRSHYMSMFCLMRISWSDLYTDVLQPISTTPDLDFSGSVAVSNLIKTFMIWIGNNFKFTFIVFLKLDTIYDQNFLQPIILPNEKIFYHIRY